MNAPIDWTSLAFVIGGMMLYLVLLFVEDWFLLSRGYRKGKALNHEHPQHGSS